MHKYVQEKLLLRERLLSWETTDLERPHTCSRRTRLCVYGIEPVASDPMYVLRDHIFMASIGWSFKMGSAALHKYMNMHVKIIPKYGQATSLYMYIVCSMCYTPACGLKKKIFLFCSYRYIISTDIPVLNIQWNLCVKTTQGANKICFLYKGNPYMQIQ